jgi:hypothetical protein
LIESILLSFHLNEKFSLEKSSILLNEGGGFYHGWNATAMGNKKRQKAEDETMCKKYLGKLSWH